MGPKQVIVVRRDLKLKRASLAALVAKASAEFFVDNNESSRNDKLTVKLTPQESEWLMGGSTRIVLGVPSETVLRNLLMKAEIAGLSCYSVSASSSTSRDAGDIGDVIEETLAVAIGPDDSDKIDQITGNLKLL